jgi:replicative DNA helicase
MSAINLFSQPPERDADSVIQALPHAVGPEKSVLSSILQDPQEFLNLAIEEGLSEAHFYLPNHSALYSVLLSLHAASEEIELVSLYQKLLDRGILEKCGGMGAITEIYTYAPSPGHFRHHLRHITDKHTLRALIRVSNQTVADVYDNPEEPNTILDEAERAIMAIREGNTKETATTIRDDLREIADDLERRIKGDHSKDTGIKTGFIDLDRMSGGLKPGEVFVIAARPSMGKTSLMMNIVENICLDQLIPTLVFSAEMPRRQIVSRLNYSRAKLHLSQLSRGQSFTKQELERFRQAHRDIGDAPLLIDDKAAPTINEIRAKARRAKRKHGIKLIALDYLQLCKSTSKQALGSREREIAEISAGLKEIAKDLEVSIIVLAQLNRDAEKRSGKSKGRPQMSDLRESGAIEQDADVIGLLTRAAYYAADEQEKATLQGKAELIIAKNRNGATGSCKLTFIEEMMRFETAAWEEEKQEETPARRW